MRQKHTLAALLSLILWTTLSMAQEKENQATLDSLMYYQKRISELQERIYDETVRYKEPLENRHYGVEINPFNTLMGLVMDRPFFALSGSVSLFNLDRNAEIIFPLAFQNGTTEENAPLTLIDLNAVYRRFLGQHQDGFYLSVGINYTYLKGREAFSWFSFEDSQEGREVTVNKAGLFFGLGYRIFSQSGLYWGAGITAGAFLFGNRDVEIQGALLSGTRIIFTLELLKFGFAF